MSTSMLLENVYNSRSFPAFPISYQDEIHEKLSTILMNDHASELQVICDTQICGPSLARLKIYSKSIIQYAIDWDATNCIEVLFKKNAVNSDNAQDLSEKDLEKLTLTQKQTILSLKHESLMRWGNNLTAKIHYLVTSIPSPSLVAKTQEIANRNDLLRKETLNDEETMNLCRDIFKSEASLLKNEAATYTFLRDEIH